ncbi:type IV secretion system protein [Asticcacaulis solisilvae]|uniref:type IV secretion system protein n=1 Tax=Asticcacaulis solisilvae TaxID=1217274 RepID=UPI003FD6EC68
MQYCPQITLVGETSVSGSLQAMDCHITQAVQTGYDRLFGPGGAFGHALQAALIIYVALIAYGFMTGRTQLTITMMSPRIVTMALVLTFVTAWPAYHAIFYGLLMNGPDEVAAALLGERGSAVMHFAQGLDGLFVKFADIAMQLDGNTAGQAATAKADAASSMLGPKPMPVTLFWLSGLFMLVSTLGALILTRMVLYLLLIIGPLFIVLGLFPQTRGLFNGWIRTSLIFSLAPMLIVLGGTAALMLFIPLIESIGNDPQAAVKAVQPMVILFMGSLIYCAFLFTLMWVAASLVRDWQAALRDKPGSGRGSSAPAPAPPVYQTPAPALAALSGSARSSDAFQRTEPLVTAVSRDAGQGAATPAARAETLGLYDPESRGGQGSADRFSRVQGLGQRFRSRPTSPLPSQPAAKPAEPTT